MKQVRTNEATRFKKGKSGNPGGRPKAEQTITELAHSHCQNAINTLADIMKDPDKSASARVAAAGQILDRGFGKPPQFSAVSAEFRRAIDMTDDELAAIATGTSD